MKRDRILFVLATSVLLGCGENAPASMNPGEDLAAIPDLGAPPDLLPPPPPFDWIGIIGTGQSLSVGAASGAIVSRTAGASPHRKLQYSGPGPCTPFDGRGMFSLVPLVEPIRASSSCGTNGEYPDNIAGETPHTAFATQLSVLARAAGGPELPTLHSVVGWSGRAIQFINKAGGQKGYPASLSEGAQFKQAAIAAGRSFGYGAVLLTHGESDTANAMYGAQVWQLAEDYNNDLRQLTGQARDVPLLLSQQHSFPTGPGRSLSTVAQWKLGVDHPGRVICVGPKYQYPYAADKVHFLSTGYIQLGQKYAQVFYEAVIRGVPWQPLQPTQVSRSGARITVKFHVPVPPLVFEDSLAPPHQTTNTQWKSGRGFEVEDSTGPLTITSAMIAQGSGDSVELVLDKAPTGMNLVVRYAMTQAATGAHGGDAMGRRGQLRDSDPFVGYDRETLPCQVTMGSADVTVSGSMQARAVMDRAAGASLAAGARIAAMPAANRLTLSVPWTGATGTADLSFWHEQYNYAVAFELPVP
jgi:hypothetical protein